MAELQLIEAVKAANFSAIKEFIGAGGDINQQDEHGWTPLNWAAGKGNLEIVKYLCEKGADVFKTGRDLRTPYLIALAAGHAGAARYLREAEDKVEGDKPVRPERKYCKAYLLKDLRRFSGWSESKINWKEKKVDENPAGAEAEQTSFTEEDVVFIHQDYTVTQSMWHDENVLFNRVSPEWKEFCTTSLNFKVLDDLDLIVPAKEEEAMQAVGD
jgi:uncharacterized protein